ncbi:hypothetical protein BGM26_19405, partial [Bacillus sp. FJAT-29790]|uniref:hypothetical protein n=1 Tax=Bacillus sp. FJAT-29790 TaxID=1895002 RepID=UPI001C241F68
KSAGFFYKAVFINFCCFCINQFNKERLVTIRGVHEDLKLIEKEKPVAMKGSLGPETPRKGKPGRHEESMRTENPSKRKTRSP